jgi:DNA repair protein RadC
MIYRGTVNTVSIRQAELLKEAVRVNSPSLIISHIHPSGDPTPSPEDVQVTRLVKEAAELLDIELVDHIVVGKGTWVSLKERGLGF